MKTAAARHGPLAPERLSHPARARRAPTDATRTMLDRLIVGLAEFSRRNALAVALGGLLLAAFSAFFAVTHLDVSTDTDLMFSRSLPWRQQADQLNKDFPQFNNLLVAVIDARESEQADATAAALADAGNQSGAAPARRPEDDRRTSSHLRFSGERPDERSDRSARAPSAYVAADDGAARSQRE